MERAHRWSVCSDRFRGRRGWRSGRGRLQLRPVLVGSERRTRGERPAPIKIAGYIQAALLGRTMGHPVRTVYKDGLEAAVPRRLSICPGPADSTVSVLFADGRRGVFRVEQGADVYSLSAAGKSALRD